MSRHRQGSHGFTLIELIVTLVIAALALAAVIPFLGSVFLRSHEPRLLLHDALDLQMAMEDVVGLHTNGLQQLHQQVGAEGSLFENRFRVIENRYIAFDGNTESGSPSTNNLLKITLQNTLGENLTRLFAVPL